jgi:hypothetical protein
MSSPSHIGATVDIGKTEVSRKLLSITGGCYDDSHSVQAGRSGAGSAERIDIRWFRRIVANRRQGTLRGGQKPGEAHACKAG